jgi:Na+/glutamate symporter
MSHISNVSTDLFVVYLMMLSLDEITTLNDRMIIKK